MWFNHHSIHDLLNPTIPRALSTPHAQLYGSSPIVFGAFPSLHAAWRASIFRRQHVERLDDQRFTGGQSERSRVEGVISALGVSLWTIQIFCSSRSSSGFCHHRGIWLNCNILGHTSSLAGLSCALSSLRDPEYTLASTPVSLRWRDLFRSETRRCA